MTKDHERKMDAHEALEAEDAPKEGETWRHYKGGLYVIKMVGLLETTLKPYIGYVSVKYGKGYFRSLSVWKQKVFFEGKRVPRFTRVA